jgi:hypothetical protein
MFSPASSVYGNTYYGFSQAIDIPPGLKWTLSYWFKSSVAGKRSKAHIYYADGNSPTDDWDYVPGEFTSLVAADTWEEHSEVFDLSLDSAGSGWSLPNGGTMLARNKATKVIFQFYVDIPGQGTSAGIWDASWIDNIQLIPFPTEHPYKHQPPPLIGANNTPYPL